MDDPNFMNATVFITELNEDGAIGFVINKMFSRKLNELVEFKSSPAFPFFDGGPVDKEHLFFIHRRPDLVTGSKEVIPGIFEGGNFSSAIEAINTKKMRESDIKIFIGYCGWDAEELESEIAEGSWEIVDLSADSIFQ